MVPFMFCFVVLTILFHSANDFGFEHLSVECSTQVVSVLPFNCVRLSLVLALNTATCTMPQLF